VEDRSRYHALSYEVNSAWDRGKPDDTPVTDLRKAIANDPKMKVMIVHGWDDLSCPYFASRLIVDQMPSYGVAQRVHLNVYPAGTCFTAGRTAARRSGAMRWRCTEDRSSSIIDAFDRSPQPFTLSEVEAHA
jgi:hypothetical protein